MKMRRGSKWAWALALGLGVGLGALARADEDDAKPAKTGNWFTRLFSKGGAKKKDEGTQKKDEAVAPPSQALARQKAYCEWQRRTEVCYKLKQIAIETGDKDLDRKADALDQRAWEVYVQQTGGAKGNLSPDEQFLEGHLGVEAAQRPQSLNTAGPNTRGGTAAASGDGRTAARRN
jgi:hypothetical protein